MFLEFKVFERLNGVNAIIRKDEQTDRRKTLLQVKKGTFYSTSNGCIFSVESKPFYSTSNGYVTLRVTDITISTLRVTGIKTLRVTGIIPLRVTGITRN